MLVGVIQVNWLLADDKKGAFMLKLKRALQREDFELSREICSVSRYLWAKYLGILANYLLFKKCLKHLLFNI